MPVDIEKFFRASCPYRQLNLGNGKFQYQPDYVPVRGKQILAAIQHPIVSASLRQPTCQLFSGLIGSGKTRELRHLQSQLEQQSFQTVFIDASPVVETADWARGAELLLFIALSISQVLKQNHYDIQTPFFKQLVQIQREDRRNLRTSLKQYLGQHNGQVVNAINADLLAPAKKYLKRQGKQDWVIIVDELDRLDSRRLPSGRSQPEAFFTDQGQLLRQLDCHVIYTFPLALKFSDEYELMVQGFGYEPHILPMIPTQNREGGNCEAGMALLRQIVLARAFPELDSAQRLQHVDEVFDTVETLDRLCRISGGHPRKLLSLLAISLQRAEELPLSRNDIDCVITSEMEELCLVVTDTEWQSLVWVSQQLPIDQEELRTLCRSLFVLEYNDDQGRWFNVNPLLAEAEKFQAFC